MNMTYILRVSSILLITSFFGTLQANASVAIHNCQELQDMSTNVAGNYVLANDIDCAATRNWNNGKGFLPIQDFTGRFDGAGYVIRDLYISDGFQTPGVVFKAVGMFGRVIEPANGLPLPKISNVSLKNVAVVGYIGGATGGLIGYIKGRVTVENVSVQGSVQGGITGGVVGQNEGGFITKCAAYTSVYGFHAAGGLVGSNYTPDGINWSSSNFLGTAGVNWNNLENISKGGVNWTDFNNTVISNSFSYGEVINGTEVGGLVGQNDGPIINSYSHSKVSTYGNYDGLTSFLGGLIGYAYKNLAAQVPNARKLLINGFSTGNVSIGTANIPANLLKTGGLIGAMSAADDQAKSSYWDTQTSAQAASAGGINVLGKATQDLYKQSTYGINWNFADVWSACESRDYPTLKWQGVPCYPVLDQKKFTSAGTSNLIYQPYFPGASAYRQYGQSVAVDGNWMVIGAPQESESGANVGAIYVYRKSLGGSWSLFQKITPAGLPAESRFGSLVDVSGNSMVVKLSAVVNGFNQDHLIPYHWDGTQWQEESRLVSPGNKKIAAMDLLGNRLAVTWGNPSGTVYLFEYVSGQWRGVKDFLSVQGGAAFSYGSILALGTDTLAIGASRADDPNIVKGYVDIWNFNRTGNVWVKQDYISNDDLGFGRSIAISGDTMVVGASNGSNTDPLYQGAVYFYERSQGLWSLSPGKLYFEGLNPKSVIGHAVAIDGDTIAVPSMTKVDKVNANNVTFPYIHVFKKVNGKEWQQAYRVISNDFLIGTRTVFGGIPTVSVPNAFGKSVALSGENIVVGAPSDSDFYSDADGSIYVFKPQSPNVQVTVSKYVGDGHGVIVSEPAGINCTGAVICNADFARNSQLTLRAYPDAGSVFAGWAVNYLGDFRDPRNQVCLDPKIPCQLTLADDVTILATFEKASNADLAVTGYSVIPAVPQSGENTFSKVNIINLGVDPSQQASILVSFGKTIVQGNTTTSWGYSYFATVPAINPGQTWQWANSNPVIFPEEGTYTVQISIYTHGEANRNNDVLNSSLVVVDNLPPVLANGLPSANLTAGTTQVSMSLSTSENATCKYDTASKAYGSMANTFSTTGQKNHSKVISGLTDNSSVAYYVRCQDTSSKLNKNQSDYVIKICGVNADCAPPTPVTNFRVTATTQTTVSLAWNTSIDDKNKVGYRVYRNGTQIAGTTLTSFTDSGLAPGLSYIYTIASYDASPLRNTSVTSLPVTGTTKPVTPPAGGNVGIGNVGIGN